MSNKTMKLPFSKYEGAGNNFIFIDMTTSQYDITPQQIQDMCRWKTGVGADGLIMLKESHLPECRYRDVYYLPMTGAEEETEACGTGATASAIVAFLHKHDFRTPDGRKGSGQSSVTSRVSMRGGELGVTSESDISSIAVRTWESGFEEETEVCGTGATASAIVAFLHKHDFRTPDGRKGSGQSSVTSRVSMREGDFGGEVYSGGTGCF
ncbi:hypothetical protein ACOMHN_032814 [Nucella lapillus]